MSEYYTLDGHSAVPCSQWPDLTKDQKRVAADQIGEAWVSTVFLILNHSWEPFGRPLIFETMIFGGPHDSYCDRYSTWEEAEEGHRHVVAALLAGRDPEESPNE